MDKNIISSELYTTAACEPTEEELETPDPEPEKAKAAINKNES